MRDGAPVTVRFRGGLLGHWSVWTRGAVELLERCKASAAAQARGKSVDAELLALDSRVTDCNSAFFDVAHDFHGCIAGCHEVLRRQGLLEGIVCLDPERRPEPRPARGDRPRAARARRSRRRRLRRREPRALAALIAVPMRAEHPESAWRRSRRESPDGDRDSRASGPAARRRGVRAAVSPAHAVSLRRHHRHRRRTGVRARPPAPRRRPRRLRLRGRDARREMVRQEPGAQRRAEPRPAAQVDRDRGRGLHATRRPRPPSICSPTTTATRCAPAASSACRRWSRATATALRRPRRARRGLPPARRRASGRRCAATSPAWSPHPVFADLGAVRLHAPSSPASQPVRRIEARHTVGLRRPDRRRRPGRRAAASTTACPRRSRRSCAAYGQRCFKLKVSGDRRADVERLVKIAGVLDSVAGPLHVTLDGNEQYDDVDAGRRALGTRWRPSRRCTSSARRRSSSSSRSSARSALSRSIAPLARLRPVIIDESDGELDVVRARALARLRRRVVEGLQGLLQVDRQPGALPLWNAEGGGGAFFLSGEDLTTQAGLAVQQDLALVAAARPGRRRAQRPPLHRRLRRPAARRGLAFLRGPSRPLRRGRPARAAVDPGRPPRARLARLPGLRQRRRARPVDHGADAEAAAWPPPRHEGRRTRPTRHRHHAVRSPSRPLVAADARHRARDSCRPPTARLVRRRQRRARTVLSKLDNPHAQPHGGRLARDPRLSRSSRDPRPGSRSTSARSSSSRRRAAARSRAPGQLLLRPTDLEGIVTAWIALDDATLENGCLYFGDGTHAGRRSRAPEASRSTCSCRRVLDKQPMTPAPVRKGGVSFHHGNTFHQSAPNHSRAGAAPARCTTCERRRVRDAGAALRPRAEAART